MLTRLLDRTATVTQVAAIATLSIAAVGLFALTALSSLNILPWLELTANFGDTTLPWAGAAVQVGFAALFLILVSFVPSSLRVLRLERSHRRFEVDMDDITRAYRAAHMADRAETFEIRREFDEVRERYKFLKGEASLSDIDEELLTIGAQMATESRELAETFSDRRIERVRQNLTQRMEEADRLEAQLKQVREQTVTLERMRNDIEVTDSRLAAQIGSLRTSLTDLELGDASREDQGAAFPGSTKH